MLNIDKDHQSITAVVEGYFQGTYHGNADQLRKTFHPDAHITGSLNGQIIDWTLADFIARVTSIPTAATKGEKYDKEILLIDNSGDAAMVKAQVVAGDLIFTDYITLLRINGQWCIRNKSFTT